MAFSNIADRATKTLIKVFGVDVTYTYLADASTSEIKGVFENSYIESNGVTTRAPTLKIRVSDLDSSPVQGDTVNINSVNYTVIDAQLDTHGTALLILEKN